MFQSTPLCEGRHRLSYLYTYVKSFNPRPCARGDDGNKNNHRNKKSFNPRPCARGDDRRRKYWTVLKTVSIHAPVRGATSHHTNSLDDMQFQSTPLCEGRPERTSDHVDLKGFNPRPCARGDLNALLIPLFKVVSIHAPVRGATSMPASTLML